MERKQNLNWAFRCSFSEFLMAYTGYKTVEKAVKHVAENEQIYSNSDTGFLTESQLDKLCNEYVEIRVQSIMPNNGIAILDLDIVTGQTEYGLLECDCVDPKKLISDIIGQI